MLLRKLHVLPKTSDAVYKKGELLTFTDLIREPYDQIHDQI